MEYQVPECYLIAAAFTFIEVYERYRYTAQDLRIILGDRNFDYLHKIFTEILYPDLEAPELCLEHPEDAGHCMSEASEW